MSAIPKRLRDIYEAEDGPNILDIAATEIERLEAELAEANATIKLVYDYDSNLIDALERRALSATPKPTDDGDFVVTPKGN